MVKIQHIMRKSKKYTIDIKSDFHEWNRYDIYLIVSARDENNNTLFYTNTNYSPSKGSQFSFECQTEEMNPKLFIYIMANEFPNSAIINDSPPFKASIEIRLNDKIAEVLQHDVNQWGGTTINDFPLPQ